MPRANFSKRTIERLRLRVAHRCSNPSCRVVTIGPLIATEGVANIGVAAHIHAASPGGPRYCAKMSDGKRRSQANGIWLCQTCSVLIDRDTDRFSPEVLLQWKAAAEQAATSEQGKRLPGFDDARNELITALTGRTTELLPSAISNVHAASVAALEKLDPRFRVESAFHDRTTLYTLHAREDVPFQITVPPEIQSEWLEKLQHTMEHGTPFQLSGPGFRLAGSPIFNAFGQNASSTTQSLAVTSCGQPGRLKLRALDPQTNRYVEFDDVAGEFVGGSKTFSFDGTGFGGFVQLRLTKSWENTRETEHFCITTHLSAWAGRDLRHLPYFDMTHQFFHALAENWPLAVSLSSEGAHILSGHINPAPNRGKMFSDPWFFDYLQSARLVLTRLGARVIMSTDAHVTAEDDMGLKLVAAMLEGPATFAAADLEVNPRFSFGGTEERETLNRLLESDEPMSFVFDQPFETRLRIFDQSVPLPNQRTTLNGVRIKAIAQQGEVVIVECQPVDGFEGSVAFVDAPPL